MPASRRDPGLSRAAREPVIVDITSKSPALERPSPAAVALRAVLPEATSLSRGERQLLEEWLARLAAGGP